MQHFDDITGIDLHIACTVLRLRHQSTLNVECQIKNSPIRFLTDSPNIMPTKITRYIRYNFFMILIFILPLTHDRWYMKWHGFMKLKISGKYQNRCLCTQTLYHGGCWLSVNRRCILDMLYFQLLIMTYSLTCKHSKNTTEISRTHCLIQSNSYGSGNRTEQPCMPFCAPL